MVMNEYNSDIIFGSDIILMVKIEYNSDIIFGSDIILMVKIEYNSDFFCMYQWGYTGVKI